MFLEELRIVGSETNIIVVEGAINISEDNIGKVVWMHTVTCV